MEKDAAGYPQGHTNPGTSRTSPATYPTLRAVLREGVAATSPPYPTPRGAIPWGHPARNSPFRLGLSHTLRPRGRPRKRKN
jgi:hypothetical protein